MKKFLIVAFIVLGIATLSSTAMAIVITPTSGGNALATSILGTGITISNLSYTGATNQAGLFTGGIASGIGIQTGILLTSGDATLVDNVNDQDNATGDLSTGGDADLDAIIGGTTYDANVLEFDFESAGGNLFFNYAFASEEYNEFTNSQFNDVFAFLLDGVNIALIPGTSTAVAINTVNGGNPLGTGASNPQYFNNNDLSDGSPFFSIEYDGFTDVFQAKALGLSAGIHHIKLAIADTSDTVLDSGVFIQGGSFSDEETPNDPVPEPSTLILLGAGLLGLGFWRKAN